MKVEIGGGVGLWLEERCQEERMSLRQAANKTGLSHSTIADIMKGCRPSAETIMKLAKAFSSDGSRERLTLEDQLLVLAGYRTPRHEEGETNLPLAQLIDTLSQFSEPQLRLMLHFAEFLSRMENE